MVQTRTGLVEQFWSLPLSSGIAKLAVVSGGLVVGEAGRLRFFTKGLKEVAEPFQYHQLSDIHKDVPLFSLRPGNIYVAPDQLHFALVDKDAAKARIIVFDGRTFTRIVDLAINNLHVSEFSIGTTGFVFSDNEKQSSVHLGTFYGSVTPWISQAPSKAKATCQLPLYSTEDKYINVCGGVAEVTAKSVRIVLAPSKKESISGSAVLSRDGATLAIIGRKTRGGGVFDTDEVQTALTLHAVSLSGKNWCIIPLGNPNLGLVTFAFADDQSIAVLNENTLALYSVRYDP